MEGCGVGVEEYDVPFPDGYGVPLDDGYGVGVGEYEVPFPTGYGVGVE